MYIHTFGLNQYQTIKREQHSKILQNDTHTAPQPARAFRIHRALGLHERLIAASDERCDAVGRYGYLSLVSEAGSALASADADGEAGAAAAESSHDGAAVS